MIKFLRYPGGKGKFISHIVKYLPKQEEIVGNYIEPFVGGGSIFLFLRPYRAIISDLNKELIDLYKAVKNYPIKVWDEFEKFPTGKKAYYDIRNSVYDNRPIHYRAARTLFLNRTCFKGMWRHNPNGLFNVGYGGEERRWAISCDNILELSKIFKNAEINNDDFEKTLNKVKDNDFVFLDPPYKPGEKEMQTAHYINGKFTYLDQVRLASTLIKCNSKKKFKWIMTNSNNKYIKNLYKDFKIKKIPIGTGNKPGILTDNSKEVLISNF